MATIHSLSLLVLSFIIFFFISLPISNSTSIDFIKASCKSTRYPSLCIRTLSSYAASIKQNHLQLAQTALSISLAKVHSATIYLTILAKSKKLQNHPVVKDCIENMRDSVDRLKDSVRELGRVVSNGGGEEFLWRMSNVETWVSAALTDENTCLDGFNERRTIGGDMTVGYEDLKGVVRSRVLTISQVTSNALALVHGFAEKHKHVNHGNEKP